MMDTRERILHLTLFLVGAGALVRGLGLKPEQLATAAFFSVLFLWMVTANRGQAPLRPVTLLDWASLALPAAYLLSTIGAASLREAVQVDIRVLTGLFVYWIIRLTLTATPGLAGKRAGLAVTYIAGAGVVLSLLGLGAAAGLIHLKDAFYSDRISSTMQYPNALAAYLIVSLLAVVTSLTRLLYDTSSPRRWLKVSGWAALFIVIAVTFLLTKSRGALLVLPVALALYLFLVWIKVGRTKAFAALAFSVVLGAASWGTLLLSDSIFSLQGSSEAESSNSQLTGGVVDRASSMSTQDYNAWSRIQWSRDALHMGMEHPIKGGGGGAWETTYLKHQSYGYWSTQVHNHFAQVFVETGIIGILAQLAVIVGVAWAALSFRKEDAHGQALLVAMTAAGVAALYMHSAIDFTLSLQAVYLLLWALLGLLGGLSAAARGVVERKKKARHTDFIITGTMVAGAVVLVLSLSLFAGDVYGRKAVAAREMDDIEAAEANLKRATGFDPLTASYRADLAVTRLALAEVSGGRPDLTAAEALVRKAIDLDPYFPGYHSLLGSILISKGDYGAGLKEMERALELNPFLANRYEDLARANFHVATRKLQSGSSRSEVKGHLEAINGIAQSMAAQSRRVPDPVPPDFRLPERTPGMSLLLGQAEALLGLPDKAEQHLKETVNSSPDAYPIPPSRGDFTEKTRQSITKYVEGLKVDAAAWLIALYREYGREGDVSQVLETTSLKEEDLAGAANTNASIIKLYKDLGKEK